jgi:serine/threonine protein kinase
VEFYPKSTRVRSYTFGVSEPMSADSSTAHPSFIGRRLGPYSIQARLGVGGMGEVYRAHDAKLARDVAIKILPALWMSDPERRARFDREARLLAAFNHPHIAAIYGVEDTEGVRALVLELVEGPTLAERLAQGPLPITEALTIAGQIAEALEAAHDRGIVHRDLKPANIKITPEGVVKVLDFGLAKAAIGDETSPDLTHSPTVTVGGTREGALLGTAAYMSPEQTSGKPTDKRSDIWAFGCVLYEMLTGDAAFVRDTLHGKQAASALRAQLHARLAAPQLRCDARRALPDGPGRQRAIGAMSLDVVLSWFDELKRRAPPGSR